MHTRMSPFDMSIKEEMAVGQGPYTYSDMLGLSLRAIAHRPEDYGKWTTAIDAGSPPTAWESITWQAEQPEGSAVKVRFRCAETEAGLASVAWGPLLDAPGAVACATSRARFGQVEVRLYPSDAGQSPVLDHLSVVWQAEEP